MGGILERPHDTWKGLHALSHLLNWRLGLEQAAKVGENLGGESARKVRSVAAELTGEETHDRILLSLFGHESHRLTNANRQLLTRLVRIENHLE